MINLVLIALLLSCLNLVNGIETQYSAKVAESKPGFMSSVVSSLYPKGALEFDYENVPRRLQTDDATGDDDDVLEVAVSHLLSEHQDLEDYYLGYAILAGIFVAFYVMNVVFSVAHKIYVAQYIPSNSYEGRSQADDIENNFDFEDESPSKIERRIITSPSYRQPNRDSQDRFTRPRSAKYTENSKFSNLYEEMRPARGGYNNSDNIRNNYNIEDKLPPSQYLESESFTNRTDKIEVIESKYLGNSQSELDGQGNSADDLGDSSGSADNTEMIEMMSKLQGLMTKLASPQKE